MSTKHITYFDFWRGLAIILVICIHSNIALNFESPLGITTVVLRQTFNCAVPIFLALSGYFMAAKELKWGSSHFAFLKEYVPSVYLPMLVWSLPLFILALYHGKNPLIETAALLTGRYSIYYFIIVIIQMYLLLPLLVKIKQWGGIFNWCNQCNWAYYMVVLRLLPRDIQELPSLH